MTETGAVKVKVQVSVDDCRTLGFFASLLTASRSARYWPRKTSMAAKAFAHCAAGVAAVSQTQSLFAMVGAAVGALVVTGALVFTVTGALVFTVTGALVFTVTGALVFAVVGTVVGAAVGASVVGVAVVPGGSVGEELARGFEPQAAPTKSSEGPNDPTDSRSRGQL